MQGRSPRGPTSTIPMPPLISTARCSAMGSPKLDPWRARFVSMAVALIPVLSADLRRFSLADIHTWVGGGSNGTVETTLHTAMIGAGVGCAVCARVVR